jgi:SpoVK/Ycf46/Vps4 family AAA+-type ATPase
VYFILLPINLIDIWVCSKSDDELDEEFDERLKNIAPEMIKMIRNEIMDVGKPVSWDDISGLESVKATIQVFTCNNIFF